MLVCGNCGVLDSLFWIVLFVDEFIGLVFVEMLFFIVGVLEFVLGEIVFFEDFDDVFLEGEEVDEIYKEELEK